MIILRITILVMFAVSMLACSSQPEATLSSEQPLFNQLLINGDENKDPSRLELSKEPVVRPGIQARLELNYSFGITASDLFLTGEVRRVAITIEYIDRPVAYEIEYRGEDIEAIVTNLRSGFILPQGLVIISVHFLVENDLSGINELHVLGWQRQVNLQAPEESLVVQLLYEESVPVDSFDLDDPSFNYAD